MGFNDMLKEAREKAGLTQEDLAAKTGLPLRSIQNWEQGHRSPRAEVVLTLAKAVGASAEQMLLAIAMGKAEESPPPKKGRKPRRK